MNPFGPIQQNTPADIIGIVFAISTITFFASSSTRRRIVQPLRRMALKLPPRPRAGLARATGWMYPTWRTDAGGSRRNRTGTPRRIEGLRRATRIRPFILLGGTYLDISLSPVGVTELARDEHSELDRVTSEPGGSAYWVGRHLFKAYSQSSFLYTRLGRGDAY